MNNGTIKWVKLNFDNGFENFNKIVDLFKNLCNIVYIMFIKTYVLITYLLLLFF